MDTAGSYQSQGPAPTNSPLRQLSSEQMNQRIPQSPSLPNFNDENVRASFHRSRESISSDVQSKVAFLNNLSTPSSPTKNFRGFGHTPTNGALQRALLGFEESQASLASAEAEIEKLKEQVKSGKHRERMVSERIESLMDQLQTERESRSNDKKFYVAEVKKCRKQTYQAELNQLETQEKLKEARQELKRAHAEVAAERTKKEEARQEAFERAYAVSGLTEEIETLKTTLTALEKERDAAVLELKTAPVREPTPGTAEEKLVPISFSPVTDPAADNNNSPTTPRPLKRSHAQTRHSQRADATSPTLSLHQCCKTRSDVLEPFWTDFVERDRMLKEYGDEVYTFEDHINSLYSEVEGTREIVERQQGQIDFLKMECQAGCCACKRAEKRGERYIFDTEFERIRDQRAAKKRKVQETPAAQQLYAKTTQPTPAQADAQQTVASEPEMSVVEEAVQVPLPSPTDQEFASGNPSPEPTAVLEDMTQVMVEPGKATTCFTFSTSTSAHVDSRMETPLPVHARSAIESSEVDLFDVTQPRHHPPRPSTAMGILTITSPERSPIRMVPDSPQPSTLPSRSATALDEHPAYSSHTTRIALKDSPESGHRRAQSRPNIRSHSQTRSPLTKSETVRNFDKSTSASPAASTVFPMTPMLKNQRALAQQTVTTTTTVPLRDVDDDSNSLGHRTPASLRGHSQSHTQPIHIPLQSEPAPDTQLLKGITGTPVSRDAALAQIRARRDRARSMNMKKMDAGSKTPGSARRGINLRDGMTRENRDVSVASVQTAPGRF
ncbi:uncharacterized protein HMPREF1541_00945 [Cyphellophora europaea CBS 101466]|uniref:Uncharacterized protein n=1 Tax=Cyphellophora europaea (strain CBS 101466) TaxID=1220924 RepID=W2SDE8_CYPE1|nr:uncharacterized protein HMPREF1541_00945 [Cyphellophora europaea CBS 101466]ETN46756.1 hypothetical protein HMPREF1541_00945 [Cyphellophora europaea CBS 101466]